MRKALFIVVLFATFAVISCETSSYNYRYNYNPYFGGVKPNAYGLGVNADAYGRATMYRLQNGDPLPPIFYNNVRRNVYGPGVHMDQFGRPVYDSPWP